jgi:thiol-disulfide isomerase/thioredoxin
MSSYLLNPILYLEIKDFTPSGNLKHFKNKTCVIMVQANYCGHCTSAKPEFQKFAQNNKSVVCLTIQGDGGDDPNNKDIVNLITTIKPTFEGFPDYFLFKRGKFVNKDINGRTEADLEQFVL